MNGRHYITLPAIADNRSLSRMTFDVKCKEIYVTPQGVTSYEVYAELTGIETKEMYALTGSGFNGLMGVKRNLLNNITTYL